MGIRREYRQQYARSGYAPRLRGVRTYRNRQSEGAALHSAAYRGPYARCLPQTTKIGGFRPAQDGIAMNAGDEHTDDGLRRTACSLVVPPGKERVRAQRASQCCHCASIQLLPGLQGRRGTPWEAVGGTNTLAPVRPMHKKCYGVVNAAPRRCSPIELRRRTGAMTA